MRKQILRSNKIRKKTETARTMLETLAVIVILTVLTVASLYGYRKIVSRFEAHSIAKMIATLVEEHRQKLMGGSREGDTETVKGPHESVLKIKDGTTGNEKDYFSVEANVGRNEVLCEELKNVSFLKVAENDEEKEGNILPSFVTVDGKLQGECPAPIKFYYAKFPGDDLDSLVYDDENGIKQICPENATCSGGHINCNSEYFKRGRNCIQCPKNALTCSGDDFTCPEGTNKTATQCVEPVSCNYPALSCDEEGNPTQCSNGYYLKNKQCLPCLDEHAITCNTNGQTTECETGYYKSGYNCIQCPDNYATCSGSGFTCKEGFTKTGTECVSNTQECPAEQHLTNGICCNYGYESNAEGTACVECFSEDYMQLEQFCENNYCKECSSRSNCGYCTECGEEHALINYTIERSDMFDSGKGGCCVEEENSYCPLNETAPEIEEVCTPTCNSCNSEGKCICQSNNDCQNGLGACTSDYCYCSGENNSGVCKNATGHVFTMNGHTFRQGRDAAFDFSSGQVSPHHLFELGKRYCQAHGERLAKFSDLEPMSGVREYTNGGVKDSYYMVEYYNRISASDYGESYIEDNTLRRYRIIILDGNLFIMSRSSTYKYVRYTDGHLDDYGDLLYDINGRNSNGEYIRLFPNTEKVTTASPLCLVE